MAFSVVLSADVRLSKSLIAVIHKWISKRLHCVPTILLNRVTVGALLLVTPRL